MSIIYCEYCDKYIDTDFNGEHFFTCSDIYICEQEEMDNNQD